MIAKRAGLKLVAGPKEDNQLTLEAAFSAGQLLQAAKKLKAKALGTTIVDLVRILYLNVLVRDKFTKNVRCYFVGIGKI